MPWWSWVLIWLGLVLVLLGMVVWFAWKLFKKLLGVLAELESLAASTEVLSRAEGPTRETPEGPRRSALFMDPADVSARHEHEQAKKEERVDARRQRRLMRGKLLVHADYREFLHLTKRK